MTVMRTRRRRALLLTALAACLPAGAGAQVEFTHMEASGRDIRKTVIADGISQFMTMRDSYVRQLNSIVIVNDKDVLVFDSNTRPSSARLILAEIRKMTDKPVRYVVNSHGHPDHWSGNDVYADAFPGLEIIATEQTDQLMRKMADVWPVRFADELKARQDAFAKEVATGKEEDGTVLTPEQRRQDQSDLLDYATFVAESKKLRRVFPTVTFTDKLTLLHGGRKFRFMSVTGDAEGTTVLYLPTEKVLITGDAVSYPIPYVSRKPSRQAEDLRILSELDANGVDHAEHGGVAADAERDRRERDGGETGTPPEHPRRDARIPDQVPHAASVFARGSVEATPRSLMDESYPPPLTTGSRLGSPDGRGPRVERHGRP